MSVSMDFILRNIENYWTNVTNDTGEVLKLLRKDFVRNEEFGDIFRTYILDESKAR